MVEQNTAENIAGAELGKANTSWRKTADCTRAGRPRLPKPGGKGFARLRQILSLDVAHIVETCQTVAHMLKITLKSD